MIQIRKMFQQLLLMILLLFSANSFFAQEKSAIINFDYKKHDFGLIELQKDSVVRTTFFFENQGSASLIIHKVTTSCGCTVPEWTKQPVEPGNKGFIKVTFNPEGFSGKFSKSIYVKSNAKEDVVILRIEGEVIKGNNKSIFNLFKNKKTVN